MSIPMTYSTYSTLHSCGQRFKFSVIDRLPQPAAVALEFGSAMHLGLNVVLTDRDLDAAQDAFSAYWASSKGKLNFKGERHGYTDLEQTGFRFLENFNKRLGKDMSLIVAEKRMYSKLGDLPIEGTPDALVEWNGRNVLLDFKTSAYNYDPCKTDLSLQLNLYAWLLEQNGHGVDELCYLVFNKGVGSIQTPYIVPYDSAKALAQIEEAVGYWKRNIGNYEKNTGSCVMGKYLCPYIEKCLKGIK